MAARWHAAQCPGYLRHRVVPGGPLDQAGLQRRHRWLDGTDVKNFASLQSVMDKLKVLGDSVSIDYRNGMNREATVVLQKAADRFV